MKKPTLIFAVLFVILASLLIAGYAFAQTDQPATPVCPYGCANSLGQPAEGTRPYGFGRGMMGAGGMMGGRWNGQRGGQAYGPLHEYMVAAMADALDLSTEDLQARLDAGETMWDVAESQGLTDEQFAELMLETRTTALNQAVADGAITQAQADGMLQRMQQMQENGFGPGNCPMHDGANNQRGSGWRWN